MRDPARIQKVLSALEHYWRRHPQLRLGQIVGNLSRGIDPYNIEDDELLLRLERELSAPVPTPKQEGGRGE